MRSVIRATCIVTGWLACLACSQGDTGRSDASLSGNGAPTSTPVAPGPAPGSSTSAGPAGPGGSDSSTSPAPPSAPTAPTPSGSPEPGPSGPNEQPGSAGMPGANEPSPSAGGGANPSDPVAPVEQYPKGPTPATEVANFPFPQNRDLPHCNTPTRYSNDDVMRAFEVWKRETVTAQGANGALRIQRLASDPVIDGDMHSTVSEGIAYGLLIAVYMNDQEMFDQLWRYEQQWLAPTGLMHWHISSAGDHVRGSGAASDADEDMAWALLMADRQWGGNGSLDRSYMDLARDVIQRMWDHEVLDGKLFLPGDSWGDWNTTNISYFTPNYYKAFAAASGNQGWNDVATTSYDVMNASLNDQNGNVSNGLVPAWSTSNGDPNGGVWGPGQSAPTHYQYDSCRTPFRIGLDYCFNGDQRAYDYVQKTSTFFSNIGVQNMTDGYELNGTPRPQFSGLSAAFVGPAGVGAMSDPKYQQFLDDAYDALQTGQLLVGGAYYDLSWTVIALLMMTGNFLDYTQLEPVR